MREVVPGLHFTASRRWNVIGSRAVAWREENGWKDAMAAAFCGGIHHTWNKKSFISARSGSAMLHPSTSLGAVGLRFLYLSCTPTAVAGTSDKIASGAYDGFQRVLLNETTLEFMGSGRVVSTSLCSTCMAAQTCCATNDVPVTFRRRRCCYCCCCCAWLVFLLFHKSSSLVGTFVGVRPIRIKQVVLFFPCHRRTPR